MQSPVQIFFDAPALAELLAAKALHPIVRAAADQQVLRVMAAPAKADAGDSTPDQLERIGIRVYPAEDGSAADYVVTAASQANQKEGTARAPGTPGPTPLSFETFGQYLRKMV